MKGYRFISAEQIIASYMVGFNTNKMTKTEFNEYGAYLEKSLSNKDYKVIAFYGKRYLDELQRDDKGFLFNIGDFTIQLAENKDKHDLDKNVLAYTEVDTLLELLEAPKKYKKTKKDELIK